MLERCVRKILSLPRVPDAVVVTGDLTDHGTLEEYGLLGELLSPLTMPVYLGVGNHDDRRAAAAGVSRSSAICAATTGSSSTSSMTSKCGW